MWIAATAVVQTVTSRAITVVYECVSRTMVT